MDEDNKLAILPTHRLCIAALVEPADVITGLQESGRLGIEALAPGTRRLGEDWISKTAHDLDTNNVNVWVFAAIRLLSTRSALPISGTSLIGPNPLVDSGNYTRKPVSVKQMFLHFCDLLYQYDTYQK